MENKGIIADIELPDEIEEDDWLVTYSDLATLLLCFFVLLLSLSEINSNRFRQLAESLQKGFGGQGGYMPLIPEQGTPPDLSLSQGAGQSEDPARDEHFALRDQLMRAFKEASGASNLPERIELLTTSCGVIVRIDGQVLFGAGSSALKPSAQPMLQAVAEIIKKTPYFLYIEGHADSSPVLPNSKFSSNWELSTARALQVLNNLATEHAVPLSRLAATGYGDTKPWYPNERVDGRARNRRVEFVFKSKEVLYTQTALD